MDEPPIHDHYDTAYDEDTRLRQGLGRLELARVQEIVRRHLPTSARVLDVGGATGVHSEWLLDDGHTVHLVDLLPGHVARASERLGSVVGFTAQVADARALPLPDASVDAVLLLGPLYHLTDRADRLAAWREAHRVVVPGGVVVAMAINRFASLFDGLAQSYLFDPAFRAIVAQDLATVCTRTPLGTLVGSRPPTSTGRRSSRRRPPRPVSSCARPSVSRGWATGSSRSRPRSATATPAGTQCSTQHA